MHYGSILSLEKEKKLYEKILEFANKNVYKPCNIYFYHFYVTQLNLLYSIRQVFAEDKDIGIVSGRVCKYTIEGFNLPFKINDDGVISLDQPLGRDAYDLYEFQVDAIDCGGMMSMRSAKVTISVETLEPPCHEGKIWFSKDVIVCNMVGRRTWCNLQIVKYSVFVH